MTNADEPVFVIESIENYLTYDHMAAVPEDYALKVVVFAVNQKGRSPGVVLKEFLFDTNIENHAGRWTISQIINRLINNNNNRKAGWCVNDATGVGGEDIAKAASLSEN